MSETKPPFHLEIIWDNNPEAMANDLFAKMGRQKADSPAEALRRRFCIVTPTRIQQAWLQQRFLYDLPRPITPHVLAQVDFELLNYFLSAWLLPPPSAENAANPRPDPDKHPFAVKSLRWKIYDFLLHQSLEDEFAPLRRYVAREGRPDPRRCFKLAGRLAKLLDEYQTYRPEMMHAWSRPGNRAGVPDDALAWEPELWRRLIAGQEDQTLLAAYRNMESIIARSGIEDIYPHIFIYMPSALPPPHLHFFRTLGERLPVTLYLYNPARENWFDSDSLKRHIRRNTLQERPVDDGQLLDLRHPLLEAYGRGCRDANASTLELTEGQIDDLGFAAPAADTLLGALQQSIGAGGHGAGAPTFTADASIQLHRCHGKMREVEILRDQLLACFEQMPGLQPRHIQVQTADLNEYAPYIEAVFATDHPNARDAIPFIIADRVAAGESRISEAFRQLLELSDSRFLATSLLELLRCDGLARQFGFAAEDIHLVAHWMNQAGIRWGRDRLHRRKASQADFTEATTWTYGLDRLFLGYALGQEPLPDDARPTVIPCDLVEGERAIQLGNLARFYEQLVAFAEFSKDAHSLEEWAARLEKLVDDFFLSDNETYRDIGVLKSAIRLLRTSARAADFTIPVPIAVVRDFLSGQLAEITGGGELNRNAVIFSSLRPGSSAPRKVQCLLGMGDTLFPRMSSRPAYDLLRETRRMGDRSTSIEDRQAFLEALLNARERLLMFYPAFSEEDNSAMHESMVLHELLDDLCREFGDGTDALPYQDIRHRLQAWHPAYFHKDAESAAPLFSFSQAHCATAQALLRQTPAVADVVAVEPIERTHPLTVDLWDLIQFFENPAKFYYQYILGADVTPKGDALPADTEPLELDSLGTWQVNQRMLELLVHQAPKEKLEYLHKELVANGLCPLEKAGEIWFQKRAEEVENTLSNADTPHGKLLDLLRAQKQAKTQSWTLPLDVPDVGPVLLTGAAPVLPNRLLLDYFSSSHKIRRLFKTWLTHLLASAADKQACHSLNVQGLNKEVKPTSLRPVSPEMAQELLTEYLHIYLCEHSPPLPFAPESSWAFVNKINSPDASETDALNVAQGTWNAFHFPESGEAHFAAAFAPEGPFKVSRAFADAAERILGPLWNHLSAEEKS